MAPMDSAKRMLVRTSLVAGSTVATLIGAQTLITVDQHDAALKAATAQVEALSTNANVSQTIVQPTVTTAVVVHTAPTIQIAHVAPSIIVVRQPGQVAANQSVQAVAQQPTAVQIQSQAVIKPPVPVQIAAPAPVIIQQQSSGAPASGGGQQAPTTRSSR